MLFANLTGELLEKKVQNLGLICHKMWGTVFYSIYPKQDKLIKIKQDYKPHSTMPGLYTEYHQAIKANPGLVQKAKDKMRAQDFFGMSYDNPEASLKFHISINNIGEVDEQVILGLIQLLKEESESPDNNMNFHFKIVDPIRHHDPRFKMNDQLTLYFDKYSSAGDLLRLAKKVDNYLRQHIPVNERPLGPKDNFGLNSFVSARFDTNKLLAEYDVYPFFDIELKKFFNKHSDKQLDQLPLCALEAVFNNVISSADIVIPKKGSTSGLSKEDSDTVALEFDKMLKDPKAYMAGVKNTERLKLEDQAQDNVRKRAKEQAIIAENITFDFAATQNVESMKTELVNNRGKIERLVDDLQRDEDLKRMDIHAYDKLGILLAEKELQLNEAIESLVRIPEVRESKKLIADLEKQKLIPPKLNHDALQNFERVLQKLKAKSDQLEQNGKNEKALCVKILHGDLNNALFFYQKGYSDYSTFAKKCESAINTAMPVLKKHSGFKEILANLWEAIKTLGVSLFKEHRRTGGKSWFFEVPTASEHLVNKIKEPIQDLQEKNINITPKNRSR